MGALIFVLILADALILLEGKLILKLYSHVEMLRGCRRELKAENKRLREEVAGIVLKID